MRFNYFLVGLTLLSLSANIPLYAQNQITGEQMPGEWSYAEMFEQELPTDDTWWKSFNNSTLDSLIALGIENNYNVSIAQHRIEMARQALRQAQAAYYPQLNLNAGWSRNRTSGMTGTTAGTAMISSYFSGNISMNWEIDLFGKISSQAKEKKASFNATKAQYAGTMVSLAANIASTYFQLRTVQAEIDILNHHIVRQKRIVEITEARHEAGLASMLDVSQARTTYYSTLASVTSLQTNESSTIYSLAVLLGVFPNDIYPWLSQHEGLPEVWQMIGVGVPMDLLRRRPDVVQAEYELASYAAAYGIAKKDFLPTLSLSGSIGTQAHKIDDLFSKESFSYSIAPTLSWTIFDGMGRKAAAATAKEQMLAGIDNYNLTLITAVQEAETAMTTYVNDLEYIQYLNDVVTQAREALTLSVDLYKQGLSPFINVTNAQITLLQYSNELAVAQGQALNALVSIYQALGGGWSI